MEYQKIANLLDNASNQPSKFRTKKWVKVNNDSSGTYTNADFKFKTDAYIIVKGAINITGAGADAPPTQLDERNKGVIFKNCTPFTKCINRINGTDIDNAQDIDIVMPMYNLIDYSNNYAKTSGSLWQYYNDDPNDNMT